MKKLNQGSPNKEVRPNFGIITNKEQVFNLFSQKKDQYFPKRKREKIIKIEIKKQSPDWMKNSCLVKYKILFSGKKESIVRATAQVDGSKKEVFEIMGKIYQNNILNKKFQIPRPLDYLKESRALFYEEAPGQPLALVLEKSVPSPLVFQKIATSLAHFQSFKKIKRPAVILKEKEYRQAFTRIKKILPSLTKKIIPIKKISFLENLNEQNAFIHGDLYAGNIVLGKKIIYFIDLDKSGRGSLFLDLVPLYFSLEFPKSIWKIKPQKEKIEKFQKTFLTSYCQERNFDLEKIKNKLEKFRSKIFLDALHFIVGFAYNGWPTIDQKAKKGFAEKINDLLIKIKEIEQ